MPKPTYTEAMATIRGALKYAEEHHRYPLTHERMYEPAIAALAVIEERQREMAELIKDLEISARTGIAIECNSLTHNRSLSFLSKMGA